MSIAGELRWKLVERFLRSARGRWLLTSDRGQALFESVGFYVVPNHFYSPICDFAGLKRNDRVLNGTYSLGGVRLNEQAQIDLLEEFHGSFFAEIDFPYEGTSNPTEYHAANEQFGFASAAMLHGMVRKYRPQRIVEVGCGYSTLVSAAALRLNHRDGATGSIVAIEPYPRPFLDQVPEVSRLVKQKVEEVGLAEFRALEANDILFIDSSHVVRTGGDVNFLYLEVLPALAPGVVVHVHDIFFPREYPRDWIVRLQRFWTEQYLLQAFLAFNDQFHVLWSGSFMHDRHRDALRRYMPPLRGRAPEEDHTFSSSFWMRRSAAAAAT